MDKKQKKSLVVLLISVAVLFVSAMVLLISFLTSSISYLADIGLFLTALFLFYAIVELVYFYKAVVGKKAVGTSEIRLRKSLSVFFIIFACSVLVAGVYPPFADGPVETVCLLLAFSYAVSEIVNFFLWSGDDVGKACGQPVRLSVIMVLFVLMVFMMLGILYFMHPGKGSPSAVADENHATTFITHPIETIGSATTEEKAPEEGPPAAGTIISEKVASTGGAKADAVLPDTPVLSDGVGKEMETCVSGPVASDTAFEEENVITEPSGTIFPPAEDVFIPDEDGMLTQEAAEIVEDKPQHAAMDGVPVPPAPTLDVPFAFTYESSPVAEEDDFWADFYIQGEELILADGIYYFDLYVNDRHAGIIQVDIHDGILRINRDEFVDFVRDGLTDDAVLKLKATPELISIDTLNSLGIKNEFDSDAYEVRVFFSSQMMPVTVLSLIGTTRSSFRPNDGNILLYPVDFSWLTQYSISLGLHDIRNRTIHDALYVDFDFNNKIRIYDLNFDFGYTIRYSGGSVGFHPGTYQFYYDFVDSQIRLKWGNISSDLLSPAGTNIGIRFDKSYSYASSDYNHKSHLEQYVAIEKDSEVTVYNGDVEIYRKTLEVGNYRLLDFTLFTGANEIRIVIKPLDGSAPIEKTISLNYIYSLLAPGEFLYGASVSTGRMISTEKNVYGVGIPYFNGYWLNYDFRNITFSGYLKAGLSESVTLNTALAVQNKPGNDSPLKINAVLANELIVAESFGYTLFNFNVSEYSEEDGKLSVPSLYLRIGQQLYTNNKLFSGLNLGLTYYSPNHASNSNHHRINASLSTSLRHGMMSYSLSGSLSFLINGGFDTTWYANNSLSFLLGNHVSINASLTLNANGLDVPSVSGRITGTVSWDGGSSYVSAGTKDMSMSLNLYDSRHRFNAVVNTDDIALIDNYRLSASYGYSGKLLNFVFDANATDSFDNLGFSTTISTSSLLAGGRVVFGSYIPSNYLLISQKGALKGNTVAVGTSGYSAGTELDASLGTYMYNRVDSQGENIAIYSYNDNSFGSASVFNISLMPSDSRKGYVFAASAEDKYSVSGIVRMPDGYLWENGSSPVYSVFVDGNGSITTEITDYYLFTDSDGRYVLSDVKPGLYGFDVDLPDGWALVVFPVIDEEDRVFDLQTVSLPEPAGFDIPDVYSYVFESNYERTITADEFWADVFGGIV